MPLNDTSVGTSPPSLQARENQPVGPGGLGHGDPLTLPHLMDRHLGPGRLRAHRAAAQGLKRELDKYAECDIERIVPELIGRARPGSEDEADCRMDLVVTFPGSSQSMQSLSLTPQPTPQGLRLLRARKTS